MHMCTLKAATKLSHLYEGYAAARNAHEKCVHGVIPGNFGNSANWKSK